MIGAPGRWPLDDLAHACRSDSGADPVQFRAGSPNASSHGPAVIETISTLSLLHSNESTLPLSSMYRSVIFGRRAALLIAHWTAMA